LLPLSTQVDYYFELFNPQGDYNQQVAFYGYLFRLLNGREAAADELARFIGFSQRVKKNLLDDALKVVRNGIALAFTKKGDGK
jgi:hypothetical protein